MDTILVDTSVLVNFLRGNPSQATGYLITNMGNLLIATCPVIIQEILQGVLNKKAFMNTKAFFDDTIRFGDDPYEMAVEAATLYMSLRTQGITIRKPNDCLIAAYAIKNNVPVLHDDRDFENIAKYSNLKIIEF